MKKLLFSMLVLLSVLGTSFEASAKNKVVMYEDDGWNVMNRVSSKN